MLTLLTGSTGIPQSFVNIENLDSLPNIFFFDKGQQQQSTVKSKKCLKSTFFTIKMELLNAFREQLTLLAYLVKSTISHGSKSYTRQQLQVCH